MIMSGRSVYSFVVAVFAVLGPIPAPALAGVRIVNDPDCGIMIEGDIRSGDVAALKAAREKVIADGGDRRVCLNSQGGSWSEGIALAKRMREAPHPTTIKSGHVCYSACAIAFMGGTEMGANVSSFPDRKLHVRGKLGFHAPYITVPEREGYDRRTVEGQYRQATTDIADLVDLAQSRHGLGGAYIIEPFLITQGLRRGPSELFMVDNVRIASLAEIEIYGAKAPPLDDRAYINACLNLFERSPTQLPTLSGQSLATTLRAPSGTSPGANVRQLQVSRNKSGASIKGFGAAVFVGYGSRCDVTPSSGQFTAIGRSGEDLKSGSNDRLNDSQFYPPETLLVSIPTQ
jgi:hypothetical protein